MIPDRILGACLSVAVTLFLCASLAAQSPTVTAFVDVNVIPMVTDRVLSSRTVLIQGEEISAVRVAVVVG